jgi:hypothetical protein
MWFGVWFSPMRVWLAKAHHNYMTTHTNLRIASNIRRSLILGSLTSVAFAAFTVSAASAAPTTGPVTICNPGVCLTVQGIDSDGDGYSDADEIAFGTDPFNAASHPAGLPEMLNTWVEGKVPFDGGRYEVIVTPTETPDGKSLIPDNGFPAHENMMDDLGTLFPEMKGLDMGNGIDAMLEAKPAEHTDPNAPQPKTNGMNINEISSDLDTSGGWSFFDIFGVDTVTDLSGAPTEVFYFSPLGVLYCNAATDECEFLNSDPNADVVEAPTASDLEQVATQAGNENTNKGSTGVLLEEKNGLGNPNFGVEDGSEPECVSNGCAELEAMQTPQDPNLNNTAGGGDGVNPDFLPETGKP